jgi:hypothetical protein
VKPCKVKYYQAIGSCSYVVQLQTFVSDSCVLLLLLRLSKYKQKLICNVNRRRTRGRPQNMIKYLMNNMTIKDLKNNMVDLMKMLMLWKSLRTFIPVGKRE